MVAPFDYSAMLWAFTRAKIVAEPSGAASIAVALDGAIDAAGPIVAIVSGGNVALDTLADLARRELEPSRPI